MKATVFFNPENLKEFLAERMDILYLSYTRNDKYYGIIELDIDSTWKFEVVFLAEIIEVRKKEGR
jgi:hypothetical protein